MSTFRSKEQLERSTHCREALLVPWKFPSFPLLPSDGAKSWSNLGRTAVWPAQYWTNMPEILVVMGVASTYIGLILSTQPQSRADIGPAHSTFFQ